MIAYEVFSGCSPYHNLAHDEFLSIKICQGLRPKFQIKIPQLLEDLIKSCWDADPLNRPFTGELYKTLSNWHQEINDEGRGKFYQQYKEIAKIINKELLSAPLSCELHSSASYVSRLLKFKNLPEPKNSQEINDKFYSQSQIIDLNKLKVQQSQIQIPPK